MCTTYDWRPNDEKCATKTLNTTQKLRVLGTFRYWSHDNDYLSNTQELDYMFLKFPYIYFVYIIAYRLTLKGKSLTKTLLWTIIVFLIYRLC